MQEFIKWGGLTPEELKARQEREWAEAIMIAEARIAAQLSSVGVGRKSDPIKFGESGRSILMTYFDPAQDEWFITCAVWPQTQPASAPYLSTPIPTGISGIGWEFAEILPIDSKGYLVKVVSTGDSAFTTFMFVDAVGTLIDSVTLSDPSNSDIQVEEGLFAGVTYLDQPSGVATVKLWSGGQVFTHTFPDATARPIWNADGIGYEDCTLDGTTTLRYASNSGQQTWMLNATTGATFNITQHLTHSTGVGESSIEADGLRMYGNYLWLLFRPQVAIQSPIVSTQQGSNQVTVVNFDGEARPRPGQVVTSAQFPTGTVVTMVIGNILTLSQQANSTQSTASMDLSGDFVDLLRIIKTDGTVTDIDLSVYNLRGVNETIPVGRYDLVIDAVQSEDISIPGWVIVYRGQDEVLLDEVVDLAAHPTFTMMTKVNPREFRTGLDDPSGVDYVTMAVHKPNTFNNKMVEYEDIKFIWFGPDSEDLCTWDAGNGEGTFGLYYNSYDQPMQRQLVLGKLITGEAALITFGLDTNLCDAISVYLPTSYSNMTNNFDIKALGSTHALVSWDDLSREGDIRAYQIWNRVTMEWNGQPLWLDPTGVSVHTSNSTLVIANPVGGSTYYWVPAINNGNSGINILDEIGHRYIYTIGERELSNGNNAWETSIGAYTNFTKSGVMLVALTETDAWLIRNQAGQTAYAISLPAESGYEWDTETRITYDLIAIPKQEDGIWKIRVLNLAGNEQYTINTGFPNLDYIRVIQNRVIAKVGDGVDTEGAYFISAHSAIFKSLTAGHSIRPNDWRWFWDWD